MQGWDDGGVEINQTPRAYPLPLRNGKVRFDQHCRDGSGTLRLTRESGSAIGLALPMA